MRFRSPSVYQPTCRYRPMGSAIPPRPWISGSPVGEPIWTSRSSRPAETASCETMWPSTLGVTSSSECDQSTTAAPVGLACPRSAAHEVLGSFSTTHSSSPLHPGLPHPVRSASRVSHPPDGFLLDELPGLVSCRSALGVPSLQSFSLARSCDASRRPMPSCR